MTYVLAHTLPTGGDHRFLPAVSSGFILGDREPLAVGLRRITIEQFDHALEGFSSGGDIDTAVHEARKSMKRLRALLRLVRPVLGDDVYRAENAVLRDTARWLAPVRDGLVVVDAVAGLRERYDGYLRQAVFADLEERLEERYQRRRIRALAEGEVFEKVVRVLRSARARYSAWPVEGDVGYGRKPIRHSYASVAGGLGATYGRGRREMEVAINHPGAANYHQWRKRVKYLRHQAEVLEPIWPEVVGGYARSLDRLGEILGEEHDLAELLRLVAELPELCPDSLERSLLAALAQQRRAELRAAANSLGSRIYAEPADRFVKRFAAYWKGWEQSPALGGVGH